MVSQGGPDDTSYDGHGIIPLMQAGYDCTSGGMERKSIMGFVACVSVLSHVWGGVRLKRRMSPACTLLIHEE